MKVIFLDVDGVLNHNESKGWQNGNWKVVDPTCLQNLKQIIAATGAKLVLMSTWRLSDAGVIELRFRGLEFIGRTPAIHCNGSRRNEEIMDWMADVWPLSFGFGGEKLDRIAVIDDESDADLGDGSFFKTSFMDGGLTEEIANRVIEHLLKPSQLIGSTK